MKLSRPLRRLLTAFALAVLAYGMGFGYLQHRRGARGPWEVTFGSKHDQPSLTINQPRLGITNVQLVFADTPPTTNMARTVTFAEAREVPFDLPFGECLFLDPLFLPGTVVIEAFGHQVQFLPRALTIDRSERPWRSGETITLPPTATNTTAQTP